MIEGFPIVNNYILQLNKFIFIRFFHMVLPCMPLLNGCKIRGKIKH